MTTAARMRSGWLASASRNTCAVPEKLPRTVAGIPSSAVFASTASTASPSDTPGARLNDTVAEGNCAV